MADFSFADILCALDDLNAPVSGKLKDSEKKCASATTYNGVLNFKISDSADISSENSCGATPRPTSELYEQFHDNANELERIASRISELEDTCSNFGATADRRQSPGRTVHPRSDNRRSQGQSTRPYRAVEVVPRSDTAHVARVLSNGSSPSFGKKTFARPHRISFDDEDDVYEENPTLRSISLTTLPAARAVRVSLENVKSLMEAEHFGDVYEKLCMETSRNRPADYCLQHNCTNDTNLTSTVAGADAAKNRKIAFVSESNASTQREEDSGCRMKNETAVTEIANIAVLTAEWNDMDAILTAPSIEITLAAEEADNQLQRSALLIQHKELRSASVKTSRDSFEIKSGQESQMVTSIFQKLTNSIESELKSVDSKEKERLRLIAQRKVEAEAEARRIAAEEAARKRAEEEARRKREAEAAAQKRAEEETRREAEEAHRLADEAAQRLVAEEAQRKATAAAAKAAEEERLRAEAEAAKSRGAAEAAAKRKEVNTPAAVGGSKNVHLQQALAMKAEFQVVEDTQIASIMASTHPQTKAFRSLCAMGLQKPLNCAATNLSTLERGTTTIIELLRNAKAAPILISTDGSQRQMSASQFAGYKFCNIMFQFCDRGQQMSTNPQSVWSYATIATTVMTQEPELRGTLFAMFFHRSMYTFPHFYAKTKTTPLLEFHQLRGQRAEEDEVHFFTRMASIVRLQHAVLVCLQEWDTMWSWYARLLNLTCRRVSVFLMWASLSTSAHDLLRIYPSQFPKILTFVRDEFLPKIEDLRRRTSEVNIHESLKLHIQNVQSFISGYFSTGRLDKPAGQSMPREISEIRDDI